MAWEAALAALGVASAGGAGLCGWLAWSQRARRSALARRLREEAAGDGGARAHQDLTLDERAIALAQGATRRAELQGPRARLPPWLARAEGFERLAPSAGLEGSVSAQGFAEARLSLALGGLAVGALLGAPFSGEFSAALGLAGAVAGWRLLGQAVRRRVAARTQELERHLPEMLDVMAMGMLQSSMGISISFFDWAVICTPIALVLLVVAWASVILVHRPDPLSEATLRRLAEFSEQRERFDALDWKVLGIFALTFALWLASNWTGWDLTGIALLGLVLCFVPGIDVLTWDEFVESVSWNVILLIGSVQALAGGIREQGAASWFLKASLGKVALGSAALVAATAVVVPLIRLFIPVGPALIGTTLVPLCLMGQEFGVSPVFFTIVVAISASTSFANGLESASMVVHKYGYWTLVDYFKSGVIPTVALIVLHATVLLPLVTAMGY